jgi:hypothetical protein
MVYEKVKKASHYIVFLYEFQHLKPYAHDLTLLARHYSFLSTTCVFVRHKGYTAGLHVPLFNNSVIRMCSVERPLQVSEMLELPRF